MEAGMSCGSTSVSVPLASSCWLEQLGCHYVPAENEAPPALNSVQPCGWTKRDRDCTQTCPGCFSVGSVKILAQVAPMVRGALPVSAATGGLSAALISSILQNSAGPSPLLCQDLLDLHHSASSLHWPSLVLGVLVGILLGQLLEFLCLARHYLQLYLRHRFGAAANSSAVKQRLGA